MGGRYLAFDLGAESGRAMAATLDGDRLAIEEVHRFRNGPVTVPLTPRGAGAPTEALYWDTLGLWRDVQDALAIYRGKHGQPASIGVDTWGVDYALLGRDGTLLGSPYNHRDPRTTGMMELAFQRVSRQEIFERTGIQFMQLNTLYQLLAATVHKSSALAAASSLLLMPDLFAYWLTGRIACEFTNATTTQAYDPRAGRWATELLDRLGIRSDLFPEIVSPGTALGTLRKSVAEQTGLEPSTRVVAVGSHDTASAVAAVPVRASDLREGETFAYVSSGTWSLVGGETPQPVITPESLAYNFTNEGGVGGYRLLKNVMGLWLVQECRRTWRERGRDWSYPALTEAAAQARPFAALVDPDDVTFLSPGDMPARFAAFWQRTGQRGVEPDDCGQVVRCALESLALKYRWVIERLERLMGQRVAVIHVVGGGSQNALLNQLTADACDRPVLAGPSEATALGNVAVQAISSGQLRSLAQARELICVSFPPAVFEPHRSTGVEEAYARFLKLLSG